MLEKIVLPSSPGKKDKKTKILKVQPWGKWGSDEKSKRTRSCALRFAGFEKDLPQTLQTGRGRMGFPARATATTAEFFLGFEGDELKLLPLLEMNSQRQMLVPDDFYRDA